MQKDINSMDRNELLSYIDELKAELKDKVVIPVHHYQSEDIVRFGDVLGDSYKLAVECSKYDAQFIVFCGVMFMAEGACVLGKPDQKVLLPEPTAGCPMAEMADIDYVEKVYAHIQSKIDEELVPVVYMNSYADLKNFCGMHDGAVCTSSNAQKIINYYLQQNKKILFFPDYYLGKNTAQLLGINDAGTARVKKDLDLELKSGINDVKIFLWDGFCPVHKRFTPGDVVFLRKTYPDIKIIVHPESMEEVVELSDMAGSTEMIYNTVLNSPAGSVWGIGTETTFVKRLAHMCPDKQIFPLRESACKNMVKITPLHLAKSLLSIKKYCIDNSEKLLYEIHVQDIYKKNAKKSLQNMIKIVNLD